MRQFEIDKLVDDIQDYLNHPEKSDEKTSPENKPSEENKELGLFIPTGSRKRMEKFLKYSKYACLAVEASAIGLLTTVVLAPFGNWPRTLMFVVGTLFFAIFALTALLGMQARIRLLLQIEENTQRIAVSKARIAAALEKFRLE